MRKNPASYDVYVWKEKGQVYAGSCHTGGWTGTSK